jgi:hypothetical protein
MNQYATTPMPGYQPPGYSQPYMEPSLSYPSPTYQGAPAPGVFRTPGPATLNTNPGAMGPGPGGVAGVSMAPVTGVVLPASTGGPHALPPLPQVPLPQGFPNPMAVQQLQPSYPGQEVPSGQSGTTTTTGPQGFFPGIGNVGPGMPGPAAGGMQGSHPAMPQMPQMEWAVPAAAPQQYQQPYQQPYAPQSYAQPQPQPQPQRQPQAQPQQNPFWLQLAWQLVQTPAVRNALAKDWERLVTGVDRARTLQNAVALLNTQESQQAFKSLTNGSLDQQSFTEGFASALRKALFPGM